MMNRLTLSIAALAAKSDFGETELVGYYHNEGLYYVMSRIETSKEADGSRIKELIVEFCTTIPNGTFGKVSKKEHTELARKVLGQINLDEISDSFVWKSHSALSRPANQSMSTLLKLLENFIDPDMTPEKGKAQLELWQKKSAKTLTPKEQTVIGGAGSIARYSLAYWLLNDPATNAPAAARTKCRDKVHIGFAARDILGGAMGGLIGFGFGGPTGAVVGAMAGGQLASCA
ncbi:MAG TPA: hypothetical protein VGQ36_21875 [Thermoanaerobaculia bacterium]|jgi:hypothetical protein|nr:hypothetical protein [Thermoanaerobaculia bacterium]